MLRRLVPVVALVLLAAPAASKTVFPPGADPALDQHMLTHTRVLESFSTRPFGIPLVFSFKDEASLALIQQFLGQTASEDVKAVTGKHPYELIGSYEGPQGIGLRGGGAYPAVAFRYMALKAEGAPESELAKARAVLLRGFEATHVAHVITGGNGRYARGIARLKSADPSDPPIPANPPTLLPFYDDQGHIQPDPKDNGLSRPDYSQGADKLPDGMWYWDDSCSKDQLDGWAMTMALLYDAAKDDPAIDAALVARLVEDARLVGKMLREKHPMLALDGNTYDYDLIIMDGDGRPSLHHDLNPLSVPFPVEPSYLPPDATVEQQNVFNLLMGVGIVKSLYHVSGDPEAEKFLYEDLLGKRKYLDMLPKWDANHSGTTGGLDYTYMGIKTNFSNVNMIAIALFQNIWFEDDPAVLVPMRAYMEDFWWRYQQFKGVDLLQTARNLKQPYFHGLHEMMTALGSDPAIGTETANLLKAYKLDPYLNTSRVNCDAAELAAKSCLAVDGKTTLTLQDDTNRGKWPVATEALDPSIRPPSSFDARSDPFEVNGGGGNDINHGGDINSAYWMLRWLPVQAAGSYALSPNARKHMPIGGVPVMPETVEVANEPVPEESPEAAVETGPEPSDDVPSGEEVAADVVVEADATAAQDVPAVEVSTSSGCAAGSGPGADGVRQGAAFLALAAVAWAVSRRRFPGR